MKVQIMPIDKFIEDTDFTAEGFDFEKFKADALAEFKKDHGAWTAKVADQDSKIAAKDSEISGLKVTNYDLLNQIPRGDDAPKPPADKQEKDPDAEPSWDDMFGAPEKKE